MMSISNVISLLFRIAALTTVLSVAACGGGGDSNTGGASETASPPQMQDPAPSLPASSQGWGAPEFVADGVDFPYYDALVLDDAGVAHAIASLNLSSEAVVSRKVLYFRRSVSGGWSHSGEIAETTATLGTSVTPAGLVVLDDGRISALTDYFDMAGAVSDIDYVRMIQNRVLNPNGTWDPIAELSANPGAVAPTQRTYGISQPGNGVYWAERTYRSLAGNGLDRYTLYRRPLLSSSGGWGAAEIVLSEFDSSFPPINTLNRSYDSFRVARRPGGRAVLVMQGIRRPVPENFMAPVRFVQTVHEQANGAWGAIEEHPDLDLGAGKRLVPQEIKVDASGNVFMLLASADTNLSSAKEVWAKRYSVGAGWSAPKRLDLPGQDANSPQIDVDAEGNAFVVWHEYDGKYAFGIWCVRYTQGEGWDTPKMISAVPFTFFEDSRDAVVKFEENGNALAVWRRYEFQSNRGVLRSARYTKGAGWSDEVTISRILPESAATEFRLALNHKGQAVVWWKESANGVKIWAAYKGN